LCSHKSRRTKSLLAVNRKHNRTLPNFVRYKTPSTNRAKGGSKVIRYNALRKNWRRTKLGI
jgi:ribosomal protein L39E